MTELIIVDKGLMGSDFDMVVAEDIKQRQKWGNQVHTGTRWVAIIAEEFGELAKAVISYPESASLSDIETEAVQLATLSLKIAAMIRRARVGASKERRQ